MPPAFTLRQVELFVRAALEGTISGASRLEHTSPTAVALAITELERHLGTQLMTRRKAKGVALTQAGTRVLPVARELLALANVLHETAIDERNSVHGVITVGCIRTLAPFILPHLYSEVQRNHPDLTLRLIEASPDALIEDLYSGACELAMFYTDKKINGLHITPIRRYRPYVLLSADHPLASLDSIPLAMLADEPLITPVGDAGLYDSEAVLKRAGISPRVVARPSTLELVRALVARNIGFAILIQEWPSETSFEGLPLVSRPIVDGVAKTTLVIAVNATSRPTVRGETVKQMCIEHFDDSV